jgi:4-hydroxybenzoate polyprenyltransferase
METEHEVTITDARGKRSSGKLKVARWDKSFRTRRALKILGLFWGLALCSVVLPLVHFVLVPGLLLAGPFVAAFFYGQEGAILGGEGDCPSCGARFTVAKRGVQAEFKQVCSSCRDELRLEWIQPAS